MDVLSEMKQIYGGANDGWLDKLEELRQMADQMSENAKNAPVTAKQQLLTSLLKQCEMMNSVLFTGRSWNILMKAYAKGKALSLSDDPSLKELRKAVSELNAAIAALETAEKAADDDERREGLPFILELGSQAEADARATASAEAAGTTEGASAGVSIGAASTGSVDISL